MRFNRPPIVLYFIISVIGLLLVVNFILLVGNSKIINANKEEQENAAVIKVMTSEIIRNVHVLDLGIRGRALIENDTIGAAQDSAISKKEKIFNSLESALIKQKFPMGKFHALRDSVNAYFILVANMNKMIKEGRRKELMVLMNKDLGYRVWYFHRQFSREIDEFENNIAMEASRNFESAVRNSYLLQAMMFLLIMPTLIYMAFYTNKSFSLSAQLLKSGEEKNAMLFDQTENLDRQVQERTRQIQVQNEEILSKNEEIIAHNEQLIAQQAEIEQQKDLLSQKNALLEEATRTIGQQKSVIELRNRELTSEVEQQNRDLMAANHELVQKNNRIAQFGYIISHNLRAPIARLLGLTSVLKFANSSEESKDLSDKTNKAAAELDQVVRDLSSILAIQRLSATVFDEIDFEEAVKKSLRILENEIRETGTEFKISIGVKSFYSLSPYIDNILYNLISNSIKYRDPDRKPMISIQNEESRGSIHVEISDNGLGLDMKLHGEKLFNLYKRFHFHVEGRGLGLYLVKTQIEMLGGTIEVRSKPNNGSTFRIILPTKFSPTNPSEALSH